MNKVANRQSRSGRRVKRENHMRLIRKMIREGAIYVFMIIVLIAAAALINGFVDDEKKEAELAETRALQFSAKLRTLKGQMARLSEALPLSQHVINGAGRSNFRLSRDRASKIFLRLRDKYVLDNVQVSISSINEPTESQLKKSKISAIFSTIEINMKAYTDEQVLSYLTDVVRELPGIVRVDQFRMNRGSPYALTREPIPEDNSLIGPTVESRIMLTWYGFQTASSGQQGGR